MYGRTTIVEVKLDRVPRPWAEPSPRFDRRQLGRRLATVALVGVAAWLAVSLAIAHQLTQRRSPRHDEPVPKVVWGTLESGQLTTRDGQQIGFWFLDGRQDAPSVLLLHGNGGRREKCLRRAAVLAGQGFAVMLISLRGHGDSTGEFNDIGYSARHDVVAAVEYLEARRPGRPVVLHGTSMGAAAAVFAAAELGHRVHGYLLESPYQDLRTAVRNRTENALPPVLDWVAYQGLSLVAPLVLPRLDEISPLAAIGGIPGDVPVLIVAGLRDRLARPFEAKALHRKVESHGRLLLFEHAGHLDFPETDPERYQRSILGFVQDVEARSRAR